MIRAEPTRRILRLRRAWAPCLVAALAATLGSQASQAADANPAQLEKVRQRLQLLQDDIGRTQRSRRDVRQQLAAVERKVSDAANQIRRAKHELAAKETRLRQLNEKKRALQRGLSSHQSALAQQIRASYVVGRQDYMKLLLNQENPSDVGRVLTYYRYFDAARAHRIDGINQELNALDQVERSIAEQARELAQLSERLTTERRVLVAMQAERREILGGIDKDLRDKSQQLERLREDERQLAEILERLQDEFADIPAEVGQESNFARLKGKLSWPAPGRIIVPYGAPRGSGHKNSQGVVIGSEEGAEVRAVARGRVAFADWLYGYGMVLILEHGGGYMSLYANNQSLAKEVGDWTEAGEVVASVGNSGGRKEASLYFEIRHNGKPDNPARWCKQ